MYLDSKESLNTVVSNFREMLSQFGDIKFNSAHQLFAKILGYNTQAALLADLPIHFYKDKSLNLKVIKEYFPDTADLILNHLQFTSSSIFESPLNDIDVVIKHHKIYNLSDYDHIDDWTESMRFFSSYYIQGDYLSYLLVTSVNNIEYDYAHKLIEKCGTHIVIVDCAISLIRTKHFDLINRLIKTQKPDIETCQKIAKLLLKNDELDYLESLLENKLINKNALASAIICLSAKESLVCLEKAKQVFLKQGGNLKGDYKDKAEQICDAFTEASTHVEYQDRIDLLLLFSNEQLPKLLAYVSICKLSDFADRRCFFEKLIEKSSKITLSKIANKIDIKTILSAYNQSLVFDTWEERISYLDKYFINTSACLKFIIDLPSTLAHIKALEKTEVENKDFPFKIIEHYIDQNFDFKACLFYEVKSKYETVRFSVVDGYLRDYYGPGIDLFIYLFDRKLLDISIEQARVGLVHEASLQVMGRDDENEHLLENGFKLLRFLMSRIALTSEDLLHTAIQHAYSGNGLALKFIEENYNLSPHFVFDEYSRKNLLSKCDLNTPFTKLIPLLIKAASSSNTRRQCLSYSLLSYIGKEAVKPYLMPDSVDIHQKIISWLENNSYGGEGYNICFR
jgi:hypothetical protein